MEERRGQKSRELVKDIVSRVRRYKSEHGIALNAPLKKLEIYGTLTDVIDITGATNTPIEIMKGNPDFEHVPVNVKPNMGVIGPKFKGQAKIIIDALLGSNPKKLVTEMEQNGKISLHTKSGIIELGPESVEVEKEVTSAGRAVDVLDVQGIPVVIIR